VRGLSRTLSITARTPFDRDPYLARTAANGARSDGEEVGRRILEQSPVIQAYLKTRRQPRPIEVARTGRPFGRRRTRASTMHVEVASDPAASEGAFLWAPEEDGQRGGEGRATIFCAWRRRTLHARGPRSHPDTDDDSFFVSPATPQRRVVLPEIVWSPACSETWTGATCLSPGSAARSR
jgi:hypothetical protein